MCKLAKLATPPLCLNINQNQIYDNLRCENKNEGLFISLVEYANDYSNICLMENAIIGNSTKSISNQANISKKCTAYPTNLLADFCNGKSECLIKLEQTDFKYGFNGANCDFRAMILTISFDCVPGK